MADLKYYVVKTDEDALEIVCADEMEVRSLPPNWTILHTFEDEKSAQKKFDEDDKKAAQKKPDEEPAELTDHKKSEAKDKK